MQMPLTNTEQKYIYNMWYNYIYTNYCLTINDIKKLKHNDIIQIFMFDIDINDILSKGFFISPNKRATYVHDQGLKGKIMYHDHPDNTYENFEFHIEYKKGYWASLDDDVILASEFKGKRQNCPTTKIGYFGPMILLNVINDNIVQNSINEIIDAFEKFDYVTYDRYFEITNIKICFDEELINIDSHNPDDALYGLNFVINANSVYKAAIHYKSILFNRLKELNDKSPNYLYIVMREVTTNSKNKFYDHLLVKK